MLTWPKMPQREGEVSLLVCCSWNILSARRIVATVDVVIAGHYSPTVNVLGCSKLLRDVLDVATNVGARVLRKFYKDKASGLSFMSKLIKGRWMAVGPR
jgi:hypothetical protein